MASGIHGAMGLSCILLSSRSSRDHSGIMGVAGAVGRGCWLGSEGENGAPLSGGAGGGNVVVKG